MPDSSRDKFTPSYEFIYLFSKCRGYYFELNAVRVKPKDINRSHKLGKNPGDVWDINTKGNSINHLAAFPESIPERVIKMCYKARRYSS